MEMSKVYQLIETAQSNTVVLKQMTCKFMKALLHRVGQHMSKNSKKGDLQKAIQQYVLPNDGTES